VRVVARAPGKAVVLGEYAVLDGAPALVLAIDRYAVAAIEPSPDSRCRLTTLLPEPVRRELQAGTPSGVGLVDLVVAKTVAAAPLPAWQATLDSAQFFAAGGKLGLGSSAAALCAWAGALAGYARLQGSPVEEPGLAGLIELHREFQGGRGSGLDVAASFAGGAVIFRLQRSGAPRIGSVRLPNSVGFAGIFAGRSASTPQLVARYRAWRAGHPKEAASMQQNLAAIAGAGCAAARGDDAAAFVESIGEYGRALQNLGVAIGTEIVTAEHRRIGELARQHGVAYKVSGAGGGDLGLACALDRDALASFTVAVKRLEFQTIDIRVAEHGLRVDASGSEVK
jgi:phosphomevalonate kinase